MVRGSKFIAMIQHWLTNYCRLSFGEQFDQQNPFLSTPKDDLLLLLNRRRFSSKARMTRWLDSSRISCCRTNSSCTFLNSWSLKFEATSWSSSSFNSEESAWFFKTASFRSSTFFMKRFSVKFRVSTTERWCRDPVVDDTSGWETISWYSTAKSWVWVSVLLLRSFLIQSDQTRTQKTI